MDKLIWGADGVAKGNFAGINIWCICGIPEGVILPVKDSKKTNKKQRKQIVENISTKCTYALGSSSPIEIDIYGIKQAEKLSLTRAYRVLWNQGYRYLTVQGDLDIPEVDCMWVVKSKDADDS